MKVKLFQPFHLVTLSPWSLLISFSLIVFLVGDINWFNNFNIYLIIYGLILLILCSFQWWRDVIRERTFQGFHCKIVVLGLKIGIILLTISEIYFLIRIFWCCLHIYLSPRIGIGIDWPPLNIYSFDPYRIPIFNTIILLSFSVSITWCYYSIF